MYRVQNVSRNPVYENLDTKGVDGKLELLTLDIRESKVLTQAQWDSVVVQKMIRRKWLRSRKA